MDMKALKSVLTKKEKKKCCAIISSSSLLASSTDIEHIQYTFDDIINFTQVHTTMIISLGYVFGINTTERTKQIIIKNASDCLKKNCLKSPFVIRILKHSDSYITKVIGWTAVEYFCSTAYSRKSKYMKDGSVQASCEYFSQLHSKAAQFLDKTIDYKTERNAYEELLDEYEQYIIELRMNSSCDNICFINDLKSDFKALFALASE